LCLSEIAILEGRAAEIAPHQIDADQRRVVEIGVTKVAIQQKRVKVETRRAERREQHASFGTIKFGGELAALAENAIGAQGAGERDGAGGQRRRQLDRG
jgi:hypothetical protein